METLVEETLEIFWKKKKKKKDNYLFKLVYENHVTLHGSLFALL